MIVATVIFLPNMLLIKICSTELNKYGSVIPREMDRVWKIFQHLPNTLHFFKSYESLFTFSHNKSAAVFY